MTVAFQTSLKLLILIDPISTVVSCLLFVTIVGLKFLDRLNSQSISLISTQDPLTISQGTSINTQDSSISTESAFVNSQDSSVNTQSTFVNSYLCDLLFLTIHTPSYVGVAATALVAIIRYKTVQK
jgi:hypothetical protein